MKTRTVIDEALCREVQLLLRGGAKIEETARITGTSMGTVSRIKAANFNLQTFNENREKRRQEEGKGRSEVKAPVQMEISVPAEEQKPEMSEQTKLMRFQAHQADRIMMMQQGIIGKLDKIYDMMGQILRAVRKE